MESCKATDMQPICNQASSLQIFIDNFHSTFESKYSALFLSGQFRIIWEVVECHGKDDRKIRNHRQDMLG